MIDPKDLIILAAARRILHELDYSAGNTRLGGEAHLAKDAVLEVLLTLKHSHEEPVTDEMIYLDHSVKA